jgi:hypothetical protein
VEYGIEDAQVLDAVLALTRRSSRSFDITAAELLPGALGLEVSARGGDRVHVRVALPSTGRDQFWLYVAPYDATDWADQLLYWIEEEVDTGGLGPSRVRIDLDGRPHVVAVSYGWQLNDPREHARLLAAAPLGDWFNGGADGP